MGGIWKAAIIAVAVIITVLLIIIIVPWGLIYLGGIMQPNPAKPEITHGEFPFTLVYEINGEEKTVKDTLICEFDGFGWNEGQGKYRKWKEHLASGMERIVLLTVDEKKEIYYDPGKAYYFMGDMKEDVEYKHDFPGASYYKKNIKTGRITEEGVISKKKLFDMYNIKIINWDYTPPIKNTFN